MCECVCVCARLFVCVSVCMFMEVCVYHSFIGWKVVFFMKPGPSGDGGVQGSVCWSADPGRGSPACPGGGGGG